MKISNKKTLILVIAVLFVFAGCKDELLFDKKEFECKDFDGLTPKIVVTGDTIKGGKVVFGVFMPGFSSNAAMGVNYRWKGPNGFEATTNNFTLTNIDSLDAGNYTVYAIRGECISQSISTVIRVTDTTTPPPPPPPINCTPPNNWANLAGVSGFENLQYTGATRTVSGGKTYVFSTGPSTQHKVSMSFNTTLIIPGEYVLTSGTGSKDVFLAIGTGSNFYTSHSNGRMKVTLNTVTNQYTFLVCGEQFDKLFGTTYPFTMKFTCK